MYIGDDMFDPIWAALDRRGATVFLHGAQTPSSTPHPHAFLGLPVTEVRSHRPPLTAHNSHRHPRARENELSGYVYVGGGRSTERAAQESKLGREAVGN